MYIPIELLIIGVAIKARKKTVSSKEVAKLIKVCSYPIEYESDNNLYYCTYDEKADTYTIKDNLQLPPYILQILTNI